MNNSYTDYDIEATIRSMAQQLGVLGFHPKSGKSLEDLFIEIHEVCPDAAEIFLEETAIKDNLKSYLDRNPSLRGDGSLIDMSGNETLKDYWNKLVKTRPLLNEAISKCKPAV